MIEVLKDLVKQCTCSAEYKASQVALVVKNLPANTGDTRDAGLIPGLRRFPGGGHGNPLQYSCLENLHGQWASVHGVLKRWTQLSDKAQHSRYIFF